MNTNTHVETKVEEQSYFAKATSWLKENCAYVAGAVVVPGGAYGAYRYFGAESAPKAEAAEPAPQAVKGVHRAVFA